MNHFNPITKEEEGDLLKSSNVEDFSDLIKIIPESLILEKDMGIGIPMSEMEIEQELMDLSNSNNNNKLCFLGGGLQDRFIPKVVDIISSRSEFATSYTPYQAEVSQGTLQYLYEFQTMICELSGMDIANASLYDGASAVAEACLLALSATNNNKILYSPFINPLYLSLIRSYLVGQNIELIKLSEINGLTDLKSIDKHINEAAALIIQSPNSNGLLENWSKGKSKINNNKTLLIAISDPYSLSLIKSPGECGADIFVGEGQALGNYLNYGGPLLGLIAVKEKYKRRMPGRIVGKTLDKENKQGFVLTLQTREQHIRRDRATSNICTNQGLIALRATIFLSLMGKNGLPYLANLSFQKAMYAKQKINKLEEYSFPYSNNFISEILVSTKHSVNKLIKYCNLNNILIDKAPYDTSDSLFIVSITEKLTKDDIDILIKCLKKFN